MMTSFFWIVSLGFRSRNLPDGFDITNKSCAELEDEGYICRRLNPAKGLQVEGENVWASVRRRTERRILRIKSPEQLITRTREKIDRLAAVLAGDAPSGSNSGYTGDMLEWPAARVPRFGHWRKAAGSEGGGR